LNEQQHVLTKTLQVYKTGNDQVDWQTLLLKWLTNQQKTIHIFLDKYIVSNYHKQVGPLRCFTVAIQNRVFWL